MTTRWREAGELGLKVGILFFLALFAYNCVYAAEIRIKWDASVGALGYKAHHGLTSGQYVTTVDAGDVLRTTLTVPPNAQYFIAVTAHNAAGDSDFSNEIATWPRAEVTSFDVACTAGPLGEECVGTLAGANYGPNVVVDIPYQGVTVGLVVRESATAVTVPFVIAADAAGGSADVVVSGPDTPGSVVTFPALVTITPTVKPAPPTGLANE